MSAVEWESADGRIRVVRGRSDSRTGAPAFDVLLDGRPTVGGTGIRRDLAFAHADWIAETLGTTPTYGQVA